jgi:hypothetical protein
MGALQKNIENVDDCAPASVQNNVVEQSANEVLYMRLPPEIQFQVDSGKMA